MSFSVRAEADSEAQAVVVEDAENVESEEAEEVLAEEKPPSKPRIKLGDVMGVIHQCVAKYLCFLYHEFYINSSS